MYSVECIEGVSSRNYEYWNMSEMKPLDVFLTLDAASAYAQSYQTVVGGVNASFELKSYFIRRSPDESGVWYAAKYIRAAHKMVRLIAFRISEKEESE